MTVYNFNLGIGWASSGVEYAQAYRAKIMRQIKQPVKFIFTDLILNENIENLTSNIGFHDDEIIWLYQFFTDIKISPNKYTLQQFEESIQFEKRQGKIEEVNSKVIRYHFKAEKQFATVYLAEPNSDLVARVEYVSRGCLIRKDYFTSTKIFSEYYAPKDQSAHLYLRRFFNQNGSIAYEELIDGNNELYLFPDKILYSKIDLIGYFIDELNLSGQDVLILDRATGIGQAVFRHHKPAKLGVVIHAEHFSENATDDTNILWNNFYEYQFDQANQVDFFVTATITQKKILEQQFKKYCGFTPKIAAIPVGGLPNLNQAQKRKEFSLITASRLATEKHIDWLILAVVQAHQQIPQLVFDIYGEGSEKKKLQLTIQNLHAEKYIKLCGHQDLENIYRNYQGYISSSTSEGFGLTLMEALGSGLALIGLDVRYGNQEFIQDQKNGYLIPYHQNNEFLLTINRLSKAINNLFTDFDLAAAHQCSYELAKKYLFTTVAKKWQVLLEELVDD